MPAPVDGYNANSVVYNIATSGHGGVEIVKQLDTFTGDQWVAAIEAAAYAMADSLQAAWPGDTITIDPVYQGAKFVPTPYPAT
jgi:hypothetical protein